MQKNKKSLKKPVALKKPVSSLAAKKSAPKAVGKKPAAKVAQPKKAAAPVKAGVKDMKKPAAPISAKAPAKSVGKAALKTPAKVPAKADKSAHKLVKDVKADKASVKAAPVKATAQAKPVTGAKKSDAEKDAPTVATHEEAAPKAIKAKKGRAAEIVEEVPEEEVVLLDADGRRYCRVRECDQASAVDGYCRFHYLLFWKNIQVRKKILSEGKLERYIEELTARYPDKYLEMLKKDLRSEKEFLAAIQELEIDEASVDNDYEDEAQNYLDEVRGMSSETGSNDRDEEF